MRSEKNLPQQTQSKALCENPQTQTTALSLRGLWPLAFVFIAAMGGFWSSQAIAQDRPVPESAYKAVRVSWAPNPVGEDVQWYTVEFNDDGLSDDTWKDVGDTSSTERTFSFQELVNTTTQLIRADDELCFRIIAKRVPGAGEPTQVSAPSEPGCFTMAGDGGPDGGGVIQLTPPTGVTVENKL